MHEGALDAQSASALFTVLPWYRVVDLLLTLDLTGPDESREVGPHPLSTANSRRQYDAARRSQHLHLGPECCSLARMVLTPHLVFTSTLLPNYDYSFKLKRNVLRGMHTW